jgi:hypothetical protein
MKSLIQSLGAASLLLGTAVHLPAEEPVPKTPAPKPPEAPILKGGGEVRQLTPEERKQRNQLIWERYDQRVKDLQAKKTAGTLTEDEAKQLERMERATELRRQKQTQGAKPEAKPAPAPKPVAPPTQ